MRLRTRKTCEDPLTFVLRKEREKDRERKRGKQRGELSILPTRTGILWILHVSGLSTHWQREHTALSGRPDNHSKLTSIFKKTILNLVSPARELNATNLPLNSRTIL